MNIFRITAVLFSVMGLTSQSQAAVPSKGIRMLCDQHQSVNLVLEPTHATLFLETSEGQKHVTVSNPQEKCDLKPYEKGAHWCERNSQFHLRGKEYNGTREWDINVSIVSDFAILNYLVPETKYVSRTRICALFH